MAEHSATDSYQIQLPAELISEAQRQPRPVSRDQLKVEGWRTSWLSRLTELLAGRE
jgi:hypothetical protein